MGTGPEKRLESLRTKLQAFDYREHVDVASLDLVERLFADLVSTTEVSARFVSPGVQRCLFGSETGRRCAVSGQVAAAHGTVES